MNTLNEKNLYLIEQEKAKQDILKEKALKKCNLDNIIELIQNNDAFIDSGNTRAEFKYNK